MPPDRRPKQPLPPESSPGSTSPHTVYTSPAPRRAQTIDQLADDGLFGAVVFGSPRSPDHAEHKRAAREKAFKDVTPVTPASAPFSFYNSAAPKRRARVSTGFKVPSSVAPGSTTPESTTPGTTTPVSKTVKAAKTATPRAQLTPSKGPAESSIAIRKLGAALTASFGMSDHRVLEHWGRKETGDKRKELIRRVAREVETDIARMAAQGEDYWSLVAETCDALKLVRDERGVQLVLSGRVETMEDPRVQRFRHVAACFRSITLDH